MATSPLKDRSCQLTIALGLVLLGLSVVLMPELWRGAAFVVTRMVYNVFAEPPNCRKGACIRMELRSASGAPLGSPTGSTQAAPAGVGQAFMIALTVDSPVDAPDLTVFLSTDRPTVALIEGEKQWKLNLKSRQAMALSSPVRFTQEGYATFYATLVTKDLARAGATIGVHVTAGGITPNLPALPAGTARPGAATIVFGATPFPTEAPTSTIPPPTPTRPPYP